MINIEKLTGTYKNEKHGEIEISKSDEDEFEVLLNGELPGIFGEEVSTGSENLKLKIIKDGSEFGAVEFEGDTVYYESTALTKELKSIPFKKV